MRRPPKKFNPHPFAYHQELELEIESLTNMGLGVARHDGWVVMVPGVIPGERVRARIFRNHKNYSEADLMAVIRPSPRRVEPGCPLFGECGGCQYQHIDYAEQLAWKRRQVTELLKRMAGIETEVRPVIGSPLEYGYRSKITPHFQKPRPGEEPVIGFLRRGSRSLTVDVPRCPIASEAINQALPEVRADLRARASSFKKGATVLLREGVEGVVTDPAALITEEVNGLRFRFPAGEFFQNNPHILPRLVDHVRKEAAAGETRFLIDAYCGSGLFSLTAAAAFEQTAGVEISERSIEWARRNAEDNGIANCRFLLGGAEQIFAGIDFPPEQTAVIIDPPRRGSDELFLSQLFEYRPARVVYVSCNPATQIRDLSHFADHGYHLESVQPFDLFPQTKHLECVATLSRTPPASEKNEVRDRAASP